MPQAGKAKSLLLLGPTGVGKSPLGDCIEQKGINGSRCLHFDFGHQLRLLGGHTTPPGGFHADELFFIREVLAGGLLLENEHFSLAEKIFLSFLCRKSFCEGDILILNGLPRHAAQAEDMEKLADIQTLVILECTAEEVQKRVEQNVGEDRVDRDDDSIEMIKKKLAIFERRTAPLVDFYSSRGRSICRLKVTAASTTEDTYKNFLSLSAFVR
jgi:adenylate kinase family enzyme